MAICNVVGCPSIATNKGRCQVHGGTHTGWSPNRDRATQAKFRQAVLARDRYVCVDCGSRNDLRACHTTPLSQGGGYDPREGVTRCATCDRNTDPYAR